MDPITIIALTLGVGWASGINLYAAILTLGIMQGTGAIVLPPNLEILAEPLVIFAAAFMYLVEFFADKIPGVDSGWDVLHTFIRIPAGAVLASQAIGPVDPAWMLAAGLVGGVLAAGMHATKAGTRLAINASPEPFSNWAASLAEDVSVVMGLWLALNHPVFFMVLLALFVALLVWLAPKLFRLLRRLFAKLFGRPSAEPPPSVA
ncbi:MAG: DUF4126 domain-containing protein [Proteobacteria bacterium]|nr:DUF4126 domain-containing protein [Pseudomonadota bacterium]